MAGLGWQELVIVLVIIMIIFGAGKLPEVARSLGQGVKEFKTEANQPGGLASSSATTTTGSAAPTTATAASGDVIADETVVVTDRPATRVDQI